MMKMREAGWLDLSCTARQLVLNEFGYIGEDYNYHRKSATSILEQELYDSNNRNIYYTIRRLYKVKMDLRKYSESFNSISNYLHECFGDSMLSAVWLYSGIEAYYHYGEKYKFSELPAFKIPDNSVILSDLDSKGVLFVSNEPFLKVIPIIK